MPWKLTIIFPDDNKPFLGSEVRLGYAQSTLLEFVDAEGKVTRPPPPPPSAFARDGRSRDLTSHLNALHSTVRRFPSTANLPTFVNPDAPPPPPSDPILGEADSAGYMAYSDGSPIADNPYDIHKEQEQHAAWGGGWKRAQYGDIDRDDESVL